MIKDINGEIVAERVWHGSRSATQEAILVPASEKGGWWQFIDHETFLNPIFSDDHPDERYELHHQLRTSYVNIVYDAFLNSDDQGLCTLAKELGLQKLGDALSIIFVTENETYASGYGPPIEIDLEAEGLLSAIPDENIDRGFGNWVLVLKAGSPFPVKLDWNYAPGF